VEFRSSNAGRAGDERFVRLLAMQTAAPGNLEAFTPRHCDLRDLRLSPEDVAKVRSNLCG